MMIKTKFLLLFLLVVSSGASSAKSDFNQCLSVFVGSKPPDIAGLVDYKLRSLCMNSFAILHSGKTKTPIAVAERLNKETLLDAKGERRSNRFYPEARLPALDRAYVDDYKRTDEDRRQKKPEIDKGHLAPAADMPDQESMAQSFSLANIVPQDAKNNRHAWAGVERATRKYVMRAQGDVYVLTGVVFEKNFPTIGVGRVGVPKYLYKLVYDSVTGRAWAHWIENSTESKAGRPIDYAELVRRVGYSPMPSLSLTAPSLN